MSELLIRKSIIAAARSMSELRLSAGTSGNVSARCGDNMLITPSGAPYDTLEPEMIARGAMVGDPQWRGPLAPSSEWRFHHDILTARPEIGAVVHTHAAYCTAFAMLRRGIPATHYMIAAFGGPDVRCTQYAPYGTQALSDLAVEGLADRYGVLLGNHGMIVIGRDLKEAMWRAVELEALAKQSYLAMMLGKPVILSDEDVLRTVKRFKSYGLAAGGNANENLD